jgi:hypothetical protein
MAQKIYRSHVSKFVMDLILTYGNMFIHANFLGWKIVVAGSWYRATLSTPIVYLLVCILHLPQE